MVSTNSANFRLYNSWRCVVRVFPPCTVSPSLIIEYKLENATLDNLAILVNNFIIFLTVAHFTFIIQLKQLTQIKLIKLIIYGKLHKIILQKCQNLQCKSIKCRFFYFNNPYRTTSTLKSREYSIIHLIRPMYVCMYNWTKQPMNELQPSPTYTRYTRMTTGPMRHRDSLEWWAPPIASSSRKRRSIDFSNFYHLMMFTSFS